MSVARLRLAPVGETMFPPRTPFFQRRPATPGRQTAAPAAPAKPATPGRQTAAPAAPPGPFHAHRPEDGL